MAFTTGDEQELVRVLWNGAISNDLEPRIPRFQCHAIFGGISVFLPHEDVWCV